MELKEHWSLLPELKIHEVACFRWLHRPSTTYINFFLHNFIKERFKNKKKIRTRKSICLWKSATHKKINEHKRRGPNHQHFHTITNILKNVKSFWEEKEHSENPIFWQMCAETFKNKLTRFSSQCQNSTICSLGSISFLQLSIIF